MIPDHLSQETPRSERFVYGRLQRELPDSFTVIHGRRFVLPGKTGAKEGELDFLVLDPKRGCIGIEVKGGGVERQQDGSWYSTDRRGQRHQIKDPGLQASSATHSIFRFLKDSKRFGGAGYACRFGWCVALPDITVRHGLGPDLPRELLLDRSDIADISSSVNRLFRFSGVEGPPLSQAAHHALLDCLLPCCNLIPSLAARFQQDAHSLIRLTEEQTATLDMLEANTRVAVEGAAGTGKTLLALEKARRLAENGYRTLLLCFNRPLADELRKSASGFEVNTFHGLCSSMAAKAGLSFPVSAAKAKTEFWEEEAPLILMEALERLPSERFDAIVVDEGQDFRENWWPVLDEALEKGQQGTLYVFFDPNQNIYGGGPPVALGVAPTRLVFNCRNTSRIAEFSANIVGIDSRVRPGAPSGAKVQEYTCADDQNVVECARRVLHQLLVEEDIRPDQIVVLSTRSTNQSALAHTRQFGNYKLVSIDGARGANEIPFVTLQRFKGLESDVIILVDVEPAQATSSPAHLYVGTSRARHLLVVISKA